MPVLSDSTRAAATCNPKPARNALGYHFDPVPAFVPVLVASGRLLAVDAVVLAVLLRFRHVPAWSCWASKAVVAERVGVSPRTVQRSFDRLGRAGVIEQKPLEGPDPADPGNRTGWRIIFLWLAPPGYEPGAGPNRAGKGAPRDARVSPPCPSPGTRVSPPAETAVSPNVAGGSDPVLDGPEPDGTKTTGNPAASSSSCSTPEGEGSDAGELAPLVEKAQAVFGEGVQNRVRAAVREHGAYRVEKALGLAVKARAKSWGYVLGILRNWTAEGGPLEPLAPRPAAPLPPNPPRPKEVPIEETPPEEVARWRESLSHPLRVMRDYGAARLRRWEEAMSRLGGVVPVAACEPETASPARPHQNKLSDHDPLRK